MKRTIQFNLSGSGNASALLACSWIFSVVVSMFMHWNVFRMELMGPHVWRQTQTLSCVHNFIEEDANILNPRRNNRGAGNGIFRMEFPVMQWCFALVSKYTGDPLLTSRILNFILASLASLGFGLWIFRMSGNPYTAAASLWAWTFAPVLYYYSVSPLPDNFALCMAVWGLCFTYTENRNGSLPLSLLFFCLSALAKLPFLLFFLLPLISALRNKTAANVRSTIVWMVLFLLPPLLWYSWVIPGWRGNGVLKGILDHPLSATEIFEIIWAHINTIWPGLMMNYAGIPVFFAAVWFFIRSKTYRHPRFLPLMLTFAAFGAYGLFEFNMITDIHDYYLFPFLPFLYLAFAYGFHKAVQSSAKILRAGLLIVLLVLPLTAWLRIQHRWQHPEKPGFNPDLLRYKNELRAAVPDSARVVAGNDLSQNIFLYYIHKKGWVFDQDLLTADSLAAFSRQGAAYLYCDSRHIDANPEFEALFEEKIAVFGSICVYRLKRP